MASGEKHIVVQNFKSGEKLNWKHHLKGQVYDGNADQIDQALKNGFIKKASELEAAQYASKAEEIKALEARLKLLKSEPAAPAPAAEQEEEGEEDDGKSGKKGNRKGK